MEIIGSIGLPIALSPEDKAQDMSIRIVWGMSCAFMMGVRFSRSNGSVLSPGEGKGFPPSPRAQWVPFQARV